MPGPAHADQQAYVAPHAAIEARDLVRGAGVLRMYCAPCGDKTPTPLQVVSAEAAEVRDAGGYWHLLVNGREVDLAYVYVPYYGVWRNLALLLELEAGGVPEMLEFAMEDPAAPPPPAVALSDVSVHLFIDRSGQWSADVTKDPEFMAVNFAPLGKGFADDDRFHAVMIKVRFTASGETFEPAKVATVRVSSEPTRKTIVEKAIAGLYVGPSGEVFVPVVVDDYPCEPLRIEVADAMRTLTRTLALHCGE